VRYTTFPGRANVAGQVPSLARLHETVGRIRWLPVGVIVKRMAERLRQPDPTVH
jgi:hypothetical protein